MKTYTGADLHKLGAFCYVKGNMRGIAGTKGGRAFIPHGEPWGGWCFRETTPARAAVFAVNNDIADVLPSDVIECVRRRQPRRILRLA